MGKISRDLVVFVSFLFISLCILNLKTLRCEEENGNNSKEIPEGTQKISEKEKKTEDIKIGDCVVCIEVHETFEEDPEFGPDRRSERISVGIVAKMLDGKVFIELKSINDISYIKDSSSWIINSSVVKPPPYVEGDIFECQPRKEEHKKPYSLRKVDVSIKKISCE